MDIFEKASRSNLYIHTEAGVVGVNDLWVSKLESLNSIAKSLKKKIDLDSEEDFLNEKPKVDEKLQLSFDIVLHIINTLKAEVEAAKRASEKRARIAKLSSILADKLDETDKNMTIEDLKKELEELSN